MELLADASPQPLLRHLGALGSPWIGNLRRALCAAGAARPQVLQIWGRDQLDDVAKASLAAGCEGVPLAPAEPAGPPLASAAAIAVAALTPGRLPGLNFAAPRVLPPRPPKLTRKKLAWTAAAAAAVLAVVSTFAGISVLNAQHQAAQLESELAAIRPQVDLARPRVAGLRFARTFVAGHERFLPCLGDLTLAVPPDQQTYLTSFGLARDMSGAIAGRAQTSQQVLALLDQLNTAGRFGKLQCRLDDQQSNAHRRGAGAGAPNNPATAAAGVRFEITFTYLPQPTRKSVRQVAMEVP